MRRSRRGDYFRSLRTLSVKGIIHFRAPFSDGFTGTLPAGETVCVLDDPPKGARGVYVRPMRDARLASRFVPAALLRSDKYDGYSIVLSFEDLESDFERIHDPSLA